MQIVLTSTLPPALAVPDASGRRIHQTNIKHLVPCTTISLRQQYAGSLARAQQLQQGRQESPSKLAPPAGVRSDQVRCSATPLARQVVAAPNTAQEYEQGSTVHLELSINKAPEKYAWPPLHRLELRLVSATQVDPVTGQGIVSLPAVAYIPRGEATVIKLHVDLSLPQGFGTPAALLLDNCHSDEFFLESVSWSTHASHPYQHFWCNSWVTQTPSLQPRIFFTNEAFLPSQTPPGLAQLRQTELDLLRGDGTGRRHLGERIYDYDVYNDLGNPDMDPASARPVLGASDQFPYPRRCRTGREHTATDPLSEAPESDGQMFYVPRDEQFSPSKQQIMDRTVNQAKLAVAIQLSADLDSAAARSSQGSPTFGSLEEIYQLYNSGSFPWPAIIDHDKDAWWKDEEFARQRLAGLNPLMIERVKEFPIVSSLDPLVYGPPTSAITARHIEHNLEGLTVHEAISQKRLFTLDYHDVLLPVLAQINSSADVNVYATRTLFFLTHEDTLKPIAIELSSPPTDGHHGALHNRVFTPPQHAMEDFPSNDETAWLWQLAKAHVAINDTGYHQLISHWLRTHASIEPFVIATHRQLSALHPVHRLLLPHLKDTLSINGQARKALINSDGVIESSFFPRELCMRFSAIIYQNWRFDEQGLPQDLIKRGMAEESREHQHGLRLTIENYPYAVDGLELWAVLQSWVRDYLDVYYANDEAVKEDEEIQKWWCEIKEVGHGDHREAEWWGTVNTKEELERVLLTIIWLASGHHAAVNFGQYAYAGFMPNSPSVGRRTIPDPSHGENAPDVQELRAGPERFILSSLAARQEAISVMGTLQLLSQHIEEEFLGEATHAHWTSEPRVTAAFRRFGRALKQVEANIDARNQDPRLYKNRHGPAQMPYKLLFPSSEQGLTNQGVPNSVAI